MAAPHALPHSFVLADLFDVESMSLPVPDHLLEDDPALAWVPCPTCDAEGWVETNSSDAGTPQHSGVMACPRCGGRGDVLDLASTSVATAPVPLKRAA